MPISVAAWSIAFKREAQISDEGGPKVNNRRGSVASRDYYKGQVLNAGQTVMLDQDSNHLAKTFPINDGRTDALELCDKRF